MTRTPEQAFSDELARDAGRPFITFYDGASGERSELSVRSLANWVAKTHHLLTDELGLGAGDAALIALPAHWISVPAVLGCLTAGLSLSTDAGSAAVAFVGPDAVVSSDGVPDTYAVNPASAAIGFGDVAPAGTLDYVSSVRPQPDKWPTVRFGAGPDDECLDGRTRAEVSAAAESRAGELGLPRGARVLSAREWAGPDDWMDTLLAPLVIGGSLVYARNYTDSEALERVAEQERVTVRI